MDKPTEGWNYYGIGLPKLPENTMAAGAVLLIKLLTADGDVVYHEFRSGDIHRIEALGMLTTARDTLKDEIKANTHRNQ